MLLLSGFEAPYPPAPSQQDLLALVREMRIMQRRRAWLARQERPKRVQQADKEFREEIRRLEAAVDRELGILSTEV